MNNIGKNIYEGFIPIPLDDSGWNGKSTIFNQLISKYKPKVIVELGTWKGQSAITMGKALKDNNLLPADIYCIDTWLGALEFWTGYAHTPERDLLLKNGYPLVYYQFLSNVIHNNLQDIIIPVPNTSITGLKILQYKGIKPNMIYVDASHEEEDVYADLKLSFSMMDKGIIFGDDLNWTGVRNAIDRFSVDLNIVYDIQDNFWILKKNIK